jgi:hypothetical protein
MARTAGSIDLAKKSSVPPVPKPLLEINGTREAAKSRIDDRIEKGLALKKKPIVSLAEWETVRNEYYRIHLTQSF